MDIFNTKLDIGQAELTSFSDSNFNLTSYLKIPFESEEKPYDGSLYVSQELEVFVKENSRDDYTYAFGEFSKEWTDNINVIAEAMYMEPSALKEALQVHNKIETVIFEASLEKDEKEHSFKPLDEYKTVPLLQGAVEPEDLMELLNSLHGAVGPCQDYCFSYDFGDREIKDSDGDPFFYHLEHDDEEGVPRITLQRWYYDYETGEFTEALTMGLIDEQIIALTAKVEQLEQKNDFVLDFYNTAIKEAKFELEADTIIGEYKQQAEDSDIYEYSVIAGRTIEGNDISICFDAQLAYNKENQTIEISYDNNGKYALEISSNQGVPLPQIPAEIIKEAVGLIIQDFTAVKNLDVNKLKISENGKSNKGNDFEKKPDIEKD